MNVRTRVWKLETILNTEYSDILVQNLNLNVKILLWKI